MEIFHRLLRENPPCKWFDVNRGNFRRRERVDSSQRGRHHHPVRQPPGVRHVM